MFPHPHLVAAVLLADRNWYTVDGQSFLLQQTREWGPSGGEFGWGFSFATRNGVGDPMYLYGPSCNIVAVAARR